MGKQIFTIMNKYQILMIALGLLLVGEGIQAQDLNLFQATDNPVERQENTRRASRNQQVTTEPAFSLIGTSRFGEKYFASLRARDGQTVLVNWTKGRIQEIEGYQGFSIADIKARTVTVRMPANECVSSEEKGVRCNGDMALLSLSNAKPLASKNTESELKPDRPSANVETSEDKEAAESETTIGNTNVLIRNPFSGELQQAENLTPEELAAREERRQRRAEQFRNFEIVRIADDEIPEGMQRIRTPFGDRLEPVED